MASFQWIPFADYGQTIELNISIMCLFKSGLSGCVALPRGAMGLSAVCDCGIS